MREDLSCTIEFIGGPYDGHREAFPVAAEQLPQDLMWLVSERAFQALDEVAESSNAVVSSIAIYERECRVGVWRYEFVDTLSPHEFGSHIVDGEFSFADLSLSRQHASRRSLRF